MSVEERGPGGGGARRVVSSSVKPNSRPTHTLASHTQSSGVGFSLAFFRGDHLQVLPLQLMAYV